MKSIIPTILAILGITLTALVAATVITFQLQITSARNFHAGVIDQIQSAYYNEQTINNCIAKAQDHGYKLFVSDATVYQDRKNVLVSMEYTTQMPLFNIQKTSVIEGYAK